MRVVPLEAFRDRISFAVAVRAVERGFRALALGEATLPDPMVVELAEQRAEVHVKGDRKSTRLNSSHSQISYAVFCLKKKKNNLTPLPLQHLPRGHLTPMNPILILRIETPRNLTSCAIRGGPDQPCQCRQLL